MSNQATSSDGSETLSDEEVSHLKKDRFAPTTEMPKQDRNTKRPGKELVLFKGSSSGNLAAEKNIRKETSYTKKKGESMRNTQIDFNPNSFDHLQTFTKNLIDDFKKSGEEMLKNMKKEMGQISKPAKQKDSLVKKVAQEKHKERLNLGKNLLKIGGASSSKSIRTGKEKGSATSSGVLLRNPNKRDTSSAQNDGQKFITESASNVQMHGAADWREGYCQLTQELHSMRDEQRRKDEEARKRELQYRQTIANIVGMFGEVGQGDNFSEQPQTFIGMPLGMPLSGMMNPFYPQPNSSSQVTYIPQIGFRMPYMLQIGTANQQSQQPQETQPPMDHQFIGMTSGMSLAGMTPLYRPFFLEPGSSSQISSVPQTGLGRPYVPQTGTINQQSQQPQKTRPLVDNASIDGDNANMNKDSSP